MQESGARSIGMTAPPAAAAEPIAGNFQSAAHTLGSEHEIDHPAELIGNEVADDARPIAGFLRRYDRRSAGLAPFEHERLACTCVAKPIPMHGHPTMGRRQGTIIDRVSDEIVQHYGR